MLRDDTYDQALATVYLFSICSSTIGCFELVEAELEWLARPRPTPPVDHNQKFNNIPHDASLQPSVCKLYRPWKHSNSILQGHIR